MTPIRTQDASARPDTMMLGSARDWPVARDTRPAAPHIGDTWEGLSRDLVERFIDVKSFGCALSRSARRGYRTDLVALDRWMRSSLRRTLVSASTADLRSYLGLCVSRGAPQRLIERMLSSLHDFYRHLNESGCREDNPARRLPQALSKHGGSTFVAGVARLLR